MIKGTMIKESMHKRAGQVFSLVWLVTVLVTSSHAHTEPRLGMDKLQGTSSIELMPSEAEVRAALAQQPKLAATKARLAGQGQEALLRRLGPYETHLALGQQHRRPRMSVESVSIDRSLGLERSLRLWDKLAVDQAWADAIESRANAERALSELSLRQQFLEHWRGFLRELLAEEAARRTAASSEALWIQAQARRRLGELAQVDEQTAKAEQLQAFADLIEARSRKLAKIEQLKKRYPVLGFDRSLPTTPAQWFGLLNAVQKLPTDIDRAEHQYIEQNPLVLLAKLQGLELGLQAKRIDLDQRPDPSLGAFVSQERSGAEHVIGVQVSIPIAGQQRAVAAKLAVHQLEESFSLNEELILEMRSDLRARLSSWQQGLLALKPRWEAYALHDEAAVRSLRAFTLGERSLTEVLQARRVADLQYIQALSQSLELLLLKTGLELDLGLRWQ